MLDAGVPVALPSHVKPLFGVVERTVIIGFFFEQVGHDPVAQMFPLEVAGGDAVENLLGVLDVLFAALLGEGPGGGQLHPQIVRIPNNFLDKEVKRIPVARFDQKAGPDIFQADRDETILQGAAETLGKYGQIADHIDLAQSRCDVFPPGEGEVRLAGLDALLFFGAEYPMVHGEEPAFVDQARCLHIAFGIFKELQNTH